MEELGSRPTLPLPSLIWGSRLWDMKYLHRLPYKQEIFISKVLSSLKWSLSSFLSLITFELSRLCDSLLVLYNLSGKMGRAVKFLLFLCPTLFFREHLYIMESTRLRHFFLVLSRPKGRQRKLWKDEGRWEHDKFREDEQAPKSRQELIALYGYDIRSAHNPDDIKPRRIRKPRWGNFAVYIYILERPLLF